MGLVHNFADLLSVGLRKTTTKNGEILRESKDNLSIDHALASDAAITVELGLLHVKLRASVSDKLIVLDKRASVEKQFNTFSCGEFVLRVVLINTGLASTS